MTDPTPDDLARLADRFYSAAFDNALWTDALEDLRQVLDVSQCAFGLMGRTTQVQRMLRDDCGESFARLFADLGQANPYLVTMRRQEAGSTFTETMFMERSRFVSGQFYAEWMRPQR